MQPKLPLLWEVLAEGETHTGRGVGTVEVKRNRGWVVWVGRQEWELTMEHASYCCSQPPANYSLVRG